MAHNKLTYQESGVDYARVDPLKITAQQAARDTAANLLRTGLAEIEASRGESAYVLDLGDLYLALTTECLGTKALVADRMQQATGKTYYASIAQDTIACAVNDVITVGARPVAIQAYWAAGGTEWFEDEERMQALVLGWKRTCDRLGIAWGGGETPSLTGIVERGAIDLAASVAGIIWPKEHLTLGAKLQAGDVIILLESSGIHTNGLTLARKLVEQLSAGYETIISDGRMYGEALLDPSVIYAPVTEAVFEAGIVPHYMAHITGHGWRKIMRHPAPLSYRMTSLPPVPPVLQFLVEQAHLDLWEAYGTFNMGAGFALFVAEKDADRAIDISQHHGINAYRAGIVESGRKRVVIEPLGITYESGSLALRA